MIMDLVTSKDLERLFQQFVYSAYRATENSDLIVQIQNNCEVLFAKDYKYYIINNTNGELSSTYPERIILLESEKNNETSDMHDKLHYDYHAVKLKNLIIKARGARCRARFPIPAILYEGKNICRSATISSRKEALARKVFDYLGSTFQGTSDQIEYSNGDNSCQSQKTGSIRDGHLNDICLLEKFSVSFIFDLMLENAKVKYGVYVSSCENIEKELYNNFSILCLPYPGSEFFIDYRNRNYNAEGLMFDWYEEYIDKTLMLPSDILVYFSNMGIDFHEYKSWDLVKLTQNYMKVILKYLLEGPSGILIHCISGWDRTPLFISLIRLSLWADGKIHVSLSPLEILYLTLAYDWYLFGHTLPQRLKSGEEVLFFCCQFLKYLASEEFSVVRKKDRKHSLCSLDPSLDILHEESYAGSNSKSSSLSSISQDSLPPGYFSVHSRESSPPINSNRPHGRNDDSKRDSVSSDSNFSMSNNIIEDYFSSVPVPVPVPSRRRADSTSSTGGCGSWQIITGAGSIRGSESSKGCVPSSAEVNQNTQTTKLPTPPLGTTSNSTSVKSTREEKLETVRSLFHKVYVTILGEKYGNTETGTFSTFYQYAVEKVGIGVRTPD